MPKKFTCPYCFENFAVKKVQHRCNSDVKACALEPDDKLSAFENLSTPKLEKRVIEKPKFSLASLFSFNKKVKCDQCNETTFKKVCPNCHNNLPRTIGKEKSVFFAVVGARSTGKSNYIAVLIDQLENKLCTKFNSDLTGLENARNIYKDRYKSYLDNNTPVPQTEKGVIPPMNWSLKFLKDNGKIGKSLTISFFDTAGEQLDCADLLHRENKYIYNSFGIILLVDPLQLKTVRARLNGNIDLDDVNTAPNQVLENVIALIQQARGLTGNQKIQIPIAVVFSKIDAVYDIIDEDNPLRYTSDHEGYFNLHEFNDVNTNMQSLLDEWNEGEAFIRKVETAFKHYAFFGVSALGCHPGKANKIAHLEPKRVEDPFLWLLHKNKFIKAKKK